MTAGIHFPITDEQVPASVASPWSSRCLAKPSRCCVSPPCFNSTGKDLPMEHSSFIQFQRPSLQNLLIEWNVVKDIKVTSQSLTCVRSWRGRMCWTEQSLGTGHTWLPRQVEAESYHDRGTPNNGSISSVSRGKRVLTENTHGKCWMKTKNVQNI